MELQWPLILFTAFVAWCAGLFASQCALALAGQGKKSQLPAWVISAVLLVVGGIAVFMHLEHWERIFNGFGNPTSGITQELVMIVVLAVVAVVYLILLVRSEDRSTVPRWIAVVGIAVSALLVIVMGHSYLMASRPAWDSVFEIVSLLGNACVMGPATMAAICALRGDELELTGKLAFWGAVVNAATSLAYAVAMQLSGAAFTDVGYHFDPTHPNKGLVDPSAAANVFAGESALVMWLGVVVVGIVVPIAASFLAKRKGDAASWKVLGAVGALAGLTGAICLRVVFYNLGLSVFALY